MKKTDFNKKLQDELGVKNIMLVPKIAKIVINVGVGKATANKKHMEDCLRELQQITGRKAYVAYSKKSISAFKLREKQAIGAKISLRGKHMEAFLDKLIKIVLPRIRDFRGLNPNSFDSFGNYSFGLTEQIVFPEIEFDKVSNLRGMDISIVTTTNNKKYAYALLKAKGLPFYGKKR